ncbi:hypothetical protein [Agromyces sp. CCNWLW203]|uniref:hypothetical protein n=1 Tax=Agromyces sp. CCNWLW203 TaxID=3112842 RepID=UPI002F96BCF3
MIIDSGWDFVQLCSTRMSWSDPLDRRLFVVAMDRDLCCSFTKVVEEGFDGDLSGIAGRVVDAVDADFIRYFATVEQVDRLSDDPFWGSQGHANLITAEIERECESRGIHLIGHYQLSPTEWRGTGPLHSFRDYPLLTVPRYEVTRPAQYDGWRRSTAPLDRFGFRDEYEVVDA